MSRLQLDEIAVAPRPPTMPESLTLHLAAELAGARIQGLASDRPLGEVVVDSRGVLPQGCLFVALRGEHFDGHDFVVEAQQKGAAAALVAADAARGLGELELPLLVVDDTLEALQGLAAGWRGLFTGPVIGVTGSNGKTIVKEMLAAIASRRRTVHRSPGSYNSQTGVALSLLGLRPEHELAIIEAGISEEGEMARLEAMIRPDLGCVTMIGLAHAAGLHDLATTAREKLNLFTRTTGPVLLPAEDPALAARTKPARPLSFGAGVDADYRIVDPGRRDGGFGFELVTPGGEHLRLDLHVPGAHNVHNAAAAAALASELGLDAEAIREGLASFELSPMRLEMHTTPAGITLINDAYSSDPTSARAALGALRDYGGGQRTIAVLGDMLDLGATAERNHRELGEVVARYGIDRLVCVGPLARHIASAAVAHGVDPDAVRRCDDNEDLVDLLDELLQPGDLVLFKGSRALGLERAARTLVESVAPERLYVDLDAIRQNFQAIRAQVGPEVGVMAVVKSFGYGNDATRISQTLVQQGVDAFCVAYPDEAIPLRRRGVEVPILVINALAAEADKFVKYGLTPLVPSDAVADALQAHAARRDREVVVHLEVETGMNRTGLKPDEALAFARRLRQRANLRLEGVMTHLAAADDPGEDAFTARQLATFAQVVDTLRADGFELPVVHAANTAGLWRFDDARFTMVRTGLGLYGLHPSAQVAGEARGTRPALRFVTQIIHLSDLAAGETVSYGRSWRAERPSRIATIAIGYNDGFPRFMSNGGEVLIGGRRCPVVGTVCMDATMVDVTDLPEVAIGDEVVLFGRQGDAAISVEELAARGDTINYEILCKISPRVRRIFVRGE